MKIKTVKYILSVLLTIFAFTSCDKEDVTMIQSQTGATKDILTFATQEDFDKTLAKVNSMTKEERLAWEKEQGFKSFGTICDEFYETINPESFKSVEEVKAFVAKNSDKIEFYTSSDGETYCVTKDFKNPMRHLINKNHKCIISDNIVNYSNNEKLNNINLMQKSPNSSLSTESNYERIEEDATGSDTYRTHVWLETYLLISGSVGLPGSNKYVVFVELKNFSRSLGIWWLKDASTTHMGYNFTISDGEYSYYDSPSYQNDSQARTETINQNIYNKQFTTSVNKTPYFVSFDGEVKSTFSKKKNWFSSTMLYVTITVNLDYNN
jgi:hypothetical protein